jgi:hypothetical protein
VSERIVTAHRVGVPSPSLIAPVGPPLCRCRCRWLAQGHAISDLLTDYAMMLLREMGLAGGAGAGAAAPAAAPAPEAPLPPVRSMYDIAATRVQAVYRGYMLRNDLHRQFAATRIQVRLRCRGCLDTCRRSLCMPWCRSQSMIRGFLARCRFDRILEEMERELT